MYGQLPKLFVHKNIGSYFWGGRGVTRTLITLRIKRESVRFAALGFSSLDDSTLKFAAKACTMSKIQNGSMWNIGHIKESASRKFAYM